MYTFFGSLCIIYIWHKRVTEGCVQTNRLTHPIFKCLRASGVESVTAKLGTSPSELLPRAQSVLLELLFQTQVTSIITSLLFILWAHFLNTYPSQLQIMLQWLANHASVFQGNGRSWEIFFNHFRLEREGTGSINKQCMFGKESEHKNRKVQTASVLTSSSAKTEKLKKAPR